MPRPPTVSTSGPQRPSQQTDQALTCELPRSQGQQERTFTLEEVAQHNRPESGWIAVNGKVSLCVSAAQCKSWRKDLNVGADAMSPCRCMTSHPSSKRIPVCPHPAWLQHTLRSAHEHLPQRRWSICPDPCRIHWRRRLRGEHRHRHPRRSRKRVQRGHTHLYVAPCHTPTGARMVAQSTTWHIACCMC